MNDDELLDDICRNKHGGEQFSEQANTAVASKKALQRAKVIEYLKTVPDTTTDEVSIALHIPYTGASARMSELKRDGMLRPVLDDKGTQACRITRNHKNAGVWRLRAASDPWTPGPQESFEFGEA